MPPQPRFAGLPRFGRRCVFSKDFRATPRHTANLYQESNTELGTNLRYPHKFTRSRGKPARKIPRPGMPTCGRCLLLAAGGRTRTLGVRAPARVVRAHGGALGLDRAPLKQRARDRGREPRSERGVAVRREMELVGLPERARRALPRDRALDVAAAPRRGGGARARFVRRAFAPPTDQLVRVAPQPLSVRLRRAEPPTTYARTFGRRVGRAPWVYIYIDCARSSWPTNRVETRVQ